MKKLIIALGAIAFAAGLQAATMNWGVNYSYDYNGNGDVDNGERGTATTYLVYLFDATEYSMTAITASIDGNTYKDDFSSKKIAEASISGTATADGSFTANVDSSLFTSTEGEISGILAIFNDANLDDATHAYFVQKTATVPVSGVAGTFLWENADRDLTGMNGPNNWTAVPEPTSGLLMLLGMAGLALRRRRA